MPLFSSNQVDICTRCDSTRSARLQTIISNMAMQSPRASRAFGLAAALTLALIAHVYAAEDNDTELREWDLRNFERCRKTNTDDFIDSKGMDITYSPVTHSLWVLTADTNAELAEFSIHGVLLRTMPIGNGDSLWVVDDMPKAPQAITWMHDYTFAVARDGFSGDQGDEEGTPTHITIIEAGPWRSYAKELYYISLDDVKDMAVTSVGSLSWDMNDNVLLAGQEKDGMKMFTVDPKSGQTERVFENLKQDSRIQDVSSTFKNPENHNAFVLTMNKRHVYQINEDGKRIAHQSTTVTGAEPIGLTFTPDGKMMYVLGDERIDAYTAVEGNCGYAVPNPILNIEAAQGKNPAPEAPASSEDDESDELEAELREAQGWMAYINMTVTGIFAEDDKELYLLRKAVAETLFVDPSSKTLIFAMDDNEKPVDPTEGNSGRRLAATSDVGEITIVVLAETKEHGQYLIAKLETAIGNGDLKGAMHSEGLKHVKNIEATGWEVIGADMLPNAFSTAELEVDAEPEKLNVVMAHEAGGKNVAGIVIGVLFAVIVAAAGVGYFAYRRHKMKYWKKDDMSERVISNGSPNKSPAASV